MKWAAPGGCKALKWLWGDSTHPRTEKPQQDGRRGKIAFRIKSHNHQRCPGSSNKACVHQDPGERSSDPKRDWPRLSCECPGLSGGEVGQWWAVAGLGHWVHQCLHGIFWRRSSLSSLLPSWFDFRSNNREGTQSRPSTENWIKIYWPWSCP